MVQRKPKHTGETVLLVAQRFSREMNWSRFNPILERNAASGPHVKTQMIEEWWNLGDRDQFLEYARERIAKDSHDVVGLYMLRHYFAGIRDEEGLLDVLDRLSEGLENIHTKYLLEIRPWLAHRIEVSLSMFVLEPIKSKIAETPPIPLDSWPFPVSDPVLVACEMDGLL